jgi:hypothetical protein
MPCLREEDTAVRATMTKLGPGLAAPIASTAAIPINPFTSSMFHLVATLLFLDRNAKLL